MDFETGETLFIDGEKFAVTTVSADGMRVTLPPADENGNGTLKLDDLNGDRMLFTRRKGVDPSDVTKPEDPDE